MKYLLKFVSNDNPLRYQGSMLKIKLNFQ